MTNDPRLIKLLKTRNKESRQNMSVARGVVLSPTTTPPKRASILIYLWCSERFESPAIRELKCGEESKCFIACDYFDFRLWRHNPLEISLRSPAEALKLVEADPANGEWSTTFIIKDPKPLGDLIEEGHDISFRNCKVAAAGCGDAQIESMWSLPATAKQNGPSIYLECK